MAGCPTPGQGRSRSLPLNQYSYAPGETVPVVVTVSDPDQQRLGIPTHNAHAGRLQSGRHVRTIWV